jgi:Fe-S cluster biosynthesis and repair protein YggX
MARMVQCAKLGRELPGLDYPPLKDALGQRIFAQVSVEAWKLWLRQSTMIINEYHLNLTEREAQQILREQMEQFFFGAGSQPPENYVQEEDE